jgi:hypothetical protein
MWSRLDDKLADLMRREERLRMQLALLGRWLRARSDAICRPDRGDGLFARSLAGEKHER